MLLSTTRDCVISSFRKARAISKYWNTKYETAAILLLFLILSILLLISLFLRKNKLGSLKAITETKNGTELMIFCLSITVCLSAKLFIKLAVYSAHEARTNEPQEARKRPLISSLIPLFTLALTITDITAFLEHMSVGSVFKKQAAHALEVVAGVAVLSAMILFLIAALIRLKYKADNEKLLSTAEEESIKRANKKFEKRKTTIVKASLFLSGIAVLSTVLISILMDNLASSVLSSKILDDTRTGIMSIITIVAIVSSSLHVSCRDKKHEMEYMGYISDVLSATVIVTASVNLTEILSNYAGKQNLIGITQFGYLSISDTTIVKWTVFFIAIILVLPAILIKRYIDNTQQNATELSIEDTDNHDRMELQELNNISNRDIESCNSETMINNVTTQLEYINLGFEPSNEEDMSHLLTQL